MSCPDFEPGVRVKRRDIQGRKEFTVSHSTGGFVYVHGTYPGVKYHAFLPSQLKKV